MMKKKQKLLQHHQLFRASGSISNQAVKRRWHEKNHYLHIIEEIQEKKNWKKKYLNKAMNIIKYDIIIRKKYIEWQNRNVLQLVWIIFFLNSVFEHILVSQLNITHHINYDDQWYYYCWYSVCMCMHVYVCMSVYEWVCLWGVYVCVCGCLWKSCRVGNIIWSICGHGYWSFICDCYRYILLTLFHVVTYKILSILLMVMCLQSVGLGYHLYCWEYNKCETNTNWLRGHT